MDQKGHGGARPTLLGDGPWPAGRLPKSTGLGSYANAWPELKSLFQNRCILAGSLSGGSWSQPTWTPRAAPTPPSREPTHKSRQDLQISARFGAPCVRVARTSANWPWGLVTRLEAVPRLFAPPLQLDLGQFVSLQEILDLYYYVSSVSSAWYTSSATSPANLRLSSPPVMQILRFAPETSKLTPAMASPPRLRCYVPF